MSESDTTISPSAGLAGIPGLGPVRRRLLIEAGITTRDALAQASPEQLVSVTGMPRAAADAVLRAISAPTSREEAIPSAVSASSPTQSETSGDGIAPGEDAPQDTRLERAALRAQTAIADASRRAAPDSKLAQTLLRFARLTDELPRRVTPKTGGAVVKRITTRLEAIVARLETLTATKKTTDTLGTKRAKRLHQRLKRTRDSIQRTLKRSADNSRRKASFAKSVPVV